MRTFATTLATVAFAALLAACATGPAEESAPGTPGAPGTRGAATPGTAQPIDSKPVPGVDLTRQREGTASGTAAAEADAIPSQRAIYFDFDRFDIKDEFRPVVEAHAKYLREHPEARTLIQGNADERGSREYNVGLGQRRAEAVRSALGLLGAQEKQMEAVSLGEEKPVCTESTESCWARNRRVDIRYGREF